MLKINKYLTDENRAGVRKLLEKYTDCGGEAADVLEENIDFLIQTATADLMDTDVEPEDMEQCLEALLQDPENDAIYSAFVNCLRCVKLVYFDKKERDGTLYPLLQADPGGENLSCFPVYTRKKQVLNPGFKDFRAHHATFAETADIIAASGCDDFIINPDTEGYIFSLEEIAEYIGACEETSSMLSTILLDGIEGEDLFPLACSLLDGTSVICNLKDGTQVTGLLVLPRVEISEDEVAAAPDADSFTVMQEIETDGDGIDTDEVQVLKADVCTISLVPEDFEDTDDGEDGEDGDADDSGAEDGE